MSEPSDRADAPPRWRPKFGFEHSVTRTSQLDAMNDGGEVAVRFEPSETRVHLSFAGSQSKSLSVWQTHSRTGFVSIPQMMDELVTIRFVDSGAMSRSDAHLGDMIVHGGQVMIAAFDRMESERASPGFSTLTATVRRRALVDAASRLTGVKADGAAMIGTVRESATREWQLVRATMAAVNRQISGVIDDHDVMMPLLEEILLFQLVAGCCEIGDPSPSQRRPDLTTARAISFIEDHLHRAITVSDIAAAADVPVRTLQLAFRRQVGMSLVQYIIARRLDKARSELKKSSSLPISVVAGRYGFNHMSDFGRRYRARFGVLPSQDRQSGR